MLEPQELKELGKIETWKTMTDISLIWATIGLCLFLTQESLWFLPLAIPILASRLHALTLIMHDGSHYLIHPNEKINDFISNVFCSFPLMLSTEVYRKTHWKHHQFTQTMKDPNYVIMQNEENWHYPKKADEVKKLLIKDLFFMGLKDHMKILKDWQMLPNIKLASQLERILFPVFMLGVFSVVYWGGFWREFLILQVGALLINPLARMRAMSEHAHYESGGQDRVHKLEETPTINAGALERFFFAPFNTNRHLEHHLYPTVPYYNLEIVHDLVAKTDTYQKHCKYELDGYLIGKKTAFNNILVGDAYPVAKKKAA
ncbi:MAG: fatty acid desaturase family protein [Bdellovibrionota bacterium]